MLLTAKDLTLHFNQKTYLNKLTFELNSGDIVGLIGRNGCGKTSLMKILVGQQDHDEGSIILRKGVKIGYLSQDFTEYPGEFTVSDRLDKAIEWILDLVTQFEKTPQLDENKHFLMDLVTRHYGWELPKHISELCNLFQVQKPTKLLSQCSGGELRRLELVCAMIGYPEVLVLDEPTNHLDLIAIENLEKTLKNYTGAVLMVSHDRYFLDNVATKMWELHGGVFFQHKGNYTKYLENKAIRMEIEASRDYKKQAYLKRELEWVHAGVRARSVKDKGRLKRYYDFKDAADFEPDLSVSMILPEPKEQGSRILELVNVGLKTGQNVQLESPCQGVGGYLDGVSIETNQEASYETLPSSQGFDSQESVDIQTTNQEVDQSIAEIKEVLRNFDFSFQPNMKIGIVGNNGVGKTTFLNMLTGAIKPNSGSVKIGNNTEFLYFDQHKAILNPNKTPIEELSESYEKMKFGDNAISTFKYLDRWLFDKPKQLGLIKRLSGGEKSRLMLAKILAKGGNFLILDEPTNDLDLDTLRVLEENLDAFEGTAVIVSHDRYFLNRVCNYIIGIEGNGSVLVSTGNYDDYVTKKIDPMLVRSYREMLKRKKVEKVKLQNDKEKTIKKLEKEIGLCEAKISELTKLFEDPEFYAKDPEKTAKSHRELSRRESELERLMLEWEKVSE